MKYSIDYPDHKLAQFIGQTLVRRHALHRVYCASITCVEKLYDDEGKPSELIFTFVDGESVTFENGSPRLNNPDYTINGATIGIKPNETQQALRNNLQNQQASRLERALKKIHNDIKPTPSKTEPTPIKYYFEASYSVDSWDSGHTTNLEHKTLKVSAENPNDALTIALKQFMAPSRTPAIIANTNELTARWYSDDACEELGSEITITIRYAN